MKVIAHRLREISHPVHRMLSELGYRDFVADEDWRHNLISTTSVEYMPARRTVMCGLTSFANDLMYEFDLATGKFISLNYQKVSEKFEIKIHRSLHCMRDGRVMGATACLHREDQRLEAPGGRIFLVNPATREYDFLGIPVPRDYIQTITVDEDRGLVYGFTYPVFNFFVFDIATRKCRRVDYMGSLPHIVALDDCGGYWATWSNRTHNLFHYNPDTDVIKFYDHSFPMTPKSCNLMVPDVGPIVPVANSGQVRPQKRWPSFGGGPIDSMVNGGDGYLYIGESFGNLDRLDPKTGEIVNLGKPTEHTRLAAMEVGADGRLYGVSGFFGICHLFAYDTKRGKFEDFGQIVDSQSGVPLFIGHDMCFVGDRRIIIGETDTADRAGYLWECAF
ncbi:MAG: hypothetical protein ABIF71_16105 [Planctomycetota bacterium]